MHGYVVAGEGATALGIRRRLGERLPDFMVPTTITVLDRLPLTPNGKLDESRLPTPQPVVGRRPPGTQGLVHGAWTAVLGGAPQPDSNFFDLGGNSLLAMKVTTELRRRGFTTMSVRLLYENPTIRALTDHLGQQTRTQHAHPQKGTTGD